MIPVYRYHAVQQDGWRFHFSTNPKLGCGWLFDGIAFYVPEGSDPNTVTLNQFHYDQKATYGGWRFNFDTTMKPESQGWTFDQVICRVYAKQVKDTVPIYQYHYPQSDGWRFLFSFSDIHGRHGWIMDGIAFYAYRGQVE